MTITQLKEDSKFLRLTEQQKTFVLVFCESNGDKKKAGHAAWRCRSDASAVAMSYRALRVPEIKSLVAEFVEMIDTRITKDEALSMLGDRARKCKDEDNETFLKIVKQIVAMEGWEVKPAAPVPTPPGGDGESDQEKISRLEK